MIKYIKSFTLFFFVLNSFFSNFKILKILKNINDIGIVKLSEHDIARHHLVKDIIDAYSKSKNK